ncbi:hypothetical protein F895_03024 [Acinetobacter sp. CIP 64.2]|nr:MULTISPECIES: hypothetical protein [Acinetobacter]ENX12647.1 hypothetical protein F895_03024 [Acinetobacter sp. CIP 64.2]
MKKLTLLLTSLTLLSASTLTMAADEKAENAIFCPPGSKICVLPI